MRLPPLSPTCSSKQRTTELVDGTKIITVSIHLDNLEQTLNSHYGLSLRRFCCSRCPPCLYFVRSSLHLENVSHVLPSRIQDLPFVEGCGISAMQNYVSPNESIACFMQGFMCTYHDFNRSRQLAPCQLIKDATYATLATRAAHTATTPLIS